MKADFEILTTINFKHYYFSGGIFNGISAAPDKDSLLFMRNNGIMLKSFAGGFSLLFDKLFAGNIRGRDEVVGNIMQLRFIVNLHDNSFYNYTSLSYDCIDPGRLKQTAADIKTKLLEKEKVTATETTYTVNVLAVKNNINNCCFYFSNKTSGNSMPVNIDVLHEDYFASAINLKQWVMPSNSAAKKYFAEIVLENAYNIKESYYIRFQSKWTFWRYILTSPYLNNLQRPSILCSDNEEFSNQPVKVLLVNNIEALVFTSKVQYQVCQSVKHLFKLVDNYDATTGNYKVIRAVLPVADSNNVSRPFAVAQKTNAEFSEIFL